MQKGAPTSAIGITEKRRKEAAASKVGWDLEECYVRMRKAAADVNV